MAASLHPTKVNLFYSSQFGSHISVIPLTQWSEPSEGHDAGTCINWLSEGADVIEMVENHVDDLLPLYKDDVIFDSWTLYTTEDETSPWTFRHAGSLVDKQGTSVSTTLRKAVQTSYTLQATDGKFARVVLLDAPIISFDRIVGYSALTADEQAVIDTLMLDSNAFCSRSGAQISVFRSRTATLNEKLRRSYKLT